VVQFKTQWFKCNTVRGGTIWKGLYDYFGIFVHITLKIIENNIKPFQFLFFGRGYVHSRVRTKLACAISLYIL
jgi:hypothetical protein